MAERLPLAPNRIFEVARAAHVSVETVQRYRQCNGDGSPRHGLRDASLYLIEKAIRELPESPQAELFTSAEQVMRKFFQTPAEKVEPRALLASIPAPSPTENTQAGDRNVTITAPEGVIPVRVDPWLSSTSMPYLLGTSTPKPAPRPRLRIEMPDGCDVPTTNEHWWEERTADA
jgi:hypothetical protein